MSQIKRVLMIIVSFFISLVLGVNQLCSPLFAEEIDEDENCVEIEEPEETEEFEEEIDEEIIVEEEATPEQIQRSEELKRNLDNALQAMNNAKSAYDDAMEKKDQGSIGFFKSVGATSAVNKIESAKYASYTDVGNWMDATSLDNMRETFDLMREGNYYRKLEGKTELKVTHDLMAIAQSNANISRSLFYHSFQYNVCENLSWYYADPYDGWYVDEKAVVQYLEKHPGASDEEVAEALGFWTTDDVQTGHYYNLIDSYYRTTGFAISKDKYGRKTYCQVFLGRASVSYTVDQYEQMLNDYCENMDAAISNYEVAENNYKEALAAYNEERVYKVTFDANGGKSTRDYMYVLNDDVYGKLPEASKDGCSFVGWKASNGSLVTESTLVNVDDDITLIAQYEKGSSLPPIVVVEKDVKSISLDSSKELKVGENVQLNAIVNPSTAENYTLTWSTSNSTIASVDNTGKVLGKKAGTATITVTSNNGVSAKCIVTVKEENSKLEGYSLFINGDIGMNFYMTLSSKDIKDAGSGMRFYLDGKLIGQVNTTSASHNNSYYTFPCNIPAKDMASEITTEFVSGNGTVNNTYKYSVEEYGRYIISNASKFSAKDVEIAKTMLTYGRYVQTYFGYNTNSLPGYVGSLQNVDLSGVKTEYLLKKENPTSTFVGARLVLTSKLGIKLYFNGSDKIYVNGVETPTTQEGKYKVITVSNISDMSKMYTITSDSFSLTYGIYAYAQKALQTSNTDLQNLVKALVAYNNAIYK